jgi:hypothetical protein
MTSIGISGCFRLEPVDGLPRNTQRKARVSFLFTKRCSTMPVSYPPNPRIRRGAYAISGLRHMMLKMPKTDELMLDFGDLVPEESTFRVVRSSATTAGSIALPQMVDRFERSLKDFVQTMRIQTPTLLPFQRMGAVTRRNDDAMR